jgi:hypothetical protein
MLACWYTAGLPVPIIPIAWDGAKMPASAHLCSLFTSFYKGKGELTRSTKRKRKRTHPGRNSPGLCSLGCPITRCSFLTFFCKVFTPWLAENVPKTSMPLGMTQEAEVLISQDLCLARIGDLTSNISLATMAPRSHQRHHLDTDRLQNISALISPTTLFPVFPMMDILVLCNINDVKDLGPIILCLTYLCTHHLSSSSTSVTYRAPSKLHFPIAAINRNKYNKI